MRYLGAGDRTMSMMSGGGSGRNNTLPAQPFVADPSMPPLPLPHTDTQLEEARRRLIEEQRDRSIIILNHYERREKKKFYQFELNSSV